MPPNRISILVALEGSDEGLKRALSSAERSLGEFSSSAKTAGDKASAGMAQVKAGMAAFGDQVSRAKGQLLAFLTIINPALKSTDRSTPKPLSSKEHGAGYLGAFLIVGPPAGRRRSCRSPTPGTRWRRG